RWAAQERDHLAKLLVVKQRQRRLQLWHRRESLVALQRPQTTPGLVLALLQGKEPMQGVAELAQHSQFWQVFQHGLQVLAFPLRQVGAAFDDQIATLEYELGLLFARLLLLLPPPLL